ncbi:DeoR/GlpR transcriptional regulator [Lactobacillus sp. PV037]|uniref:DeoR/GlpR family DNA-binding transcription regulator n=1 Tax=unclassified Lactobacillus TaxID=2620435 RepID=UPI00223F1D04|nr:MULTISPECIES: DeoR/GlpR family DNA-binding transcription regulator [unclassified Lactobacillus]QNQ82798.1 DeoR/GlpR transcriptional regulator [Lactobacillus sp. PV012]QNQ83080.1 DeoR/GlpR transcriptional regulator [Lactobacillus sp. PV037]
MLTEKRQQAIAAYINDKDICRVAELCKLTNSSESTIRRDLIEMEKRGLIVRVHGGARSVQNYSRDVEQQVRFNLNIDKKHRLAAYAAKKISSAEHLFLDAGTTIYEMINFLKDIPDLHVITNGVDTALACIDAGISTQILGGEIKQQTNAVIGSSTIKQMQAMNFSTAFIGANGLNKQGKFTTPDPSEAEIKQTAIIQAKRSFILMDDSKIGTSNFASLSNTENAVLITNQLSSKQKLLLPKELKFEEAK